MYNSLDDVKETLSGLKEKTYTSLNEDLQKAVYEFMPKLFNAGMEGTSLTLNFDKCPQLSPEQRKVIDGIMKGIIKAGAEFYVYLSNCSYSPIYDKEEIESFVLELFDGYAEAQGKEIRKTTILSKPLDTGKKKF